MSYLCINPQFPLQIVRCDRAARPPRAASQNWCSRINKLPSTERPSILGTIKLSKCIQGSLGIANITESSTLPFAQQETRYCRRVIAACAYLFGTSPPALPRRYLSPASSWLYRLYNKLRLLRNNRSVICRPNVCGD